MESSNSNSKERELQLTQRLVKQRHSHCMAWFEQLETHLRDLYLNSSSHAVDAFKPAFHSFFGEEHQTFRLKIIYNLNQLRLQLERENLLKVNPRTCLEALRTQFKEFFASKRINPVQAVDDRLSVSKSSWIESENNNALSKLVNETQLQQHESLVTESTTLEANLSMDVNALDVGLAVTESNEANSYKQDTSSSSGTYTTHVVDAYIIPVNDQVSSAEVHLTAQHNVLANEQQHTDQSEPSYDTYLLEKVDSNTTPDSTNMSHRGGEIDQDAEQDQVKSPLLKPEFLKTNDMVEKEVYNELSNRFLQLEKHCISLEISMQQKEESFQSHKPCKNQESLDVKEASNEAKLKKEINVLETINIELESSVAKLLAKNEKLNMKNEHLKQTYKELYVSIKKTRIQTKDHNDSLIAQVNSKTVENADLKAQIQEKISSGHRFSPKKTFAVYEKTSPRSCLRWIPTGRIFNLAGLRWIPTGKMFIDSTTKVDSEPPNGSNEDITNPYECDQTFNVSACTFNLSVVQSSLFNKKWRLQTTLQAPFLKEKKGVRFSALYLQKKRNLLVFDHSHQHSSNFPMLVQSLSGSTLTWSLNVYEMVKLTPRYISSGLVQNPVSPIPYVPPSKKDYEIMFQLLFDEYFNPPPRAVSPDPVAVAAPRAEIQSQVTHQGVEEQIHGHQNAQFDNAPLLHNLSSDPSSEETTLQGVIPQNLHHLNQSFDTLTKLTKNHPLENVIGDPSRPVSTRSQLQEHAIWCYFDANVNPIPFGGKQSG
ncbi:hypothetical protein Tco_1327609 [Tanacetum coccineum]